MAASPVNQKSSYHTRSNSFPSRTHPLISEFDDCLCRLRSSESTSVSSSSICSTLNGLQDLHDCIDRLLLLPYNQQAFAQEHHQTWVEELLNGSLGLVEACGIAKDSLMQTREGTQELQSIMRRRRGGGTEVTSEIRKYLTSRKLVKKTIHKALNRLESRCNNKNQEASALVSMLRDAEWVTRSVLESLFSFIAGPKLRSKSSSWLFVSRLVSAKRVACDDGESVRNELEKVDAALQHLICLKTGKSCYMKLDEHVQNSLEESESSIEDLEEALECLLRRLIKSRVSLLNIFNH